MDVEDLRKGVEDHLHLHTLFDSSTGLHWLFVVSLFWEYRKSGLDAAGWFADSLLRLNTNTDVRPLFWGALDKMDRCVATCDTELTLVELLTKSITESQPKPSPPKETSSPYPRGRMLMSVDPTDVTTHSRNPLLQGLLVFHLLL